MSVELRPHHALCLQFFEGKGYSEAFIEHMYMIERELENDPLVKLTEGCDDICAICPHMVGGICDHREKVCGIDRRASDIIGLEEYSELSWSELSALSRERVIDAGKLSDVCRDCQWITICDK